MSPAPVARTSAATGAFFDRPSPADAALGRIEAIRSVLRAKPPLAISDLALDGEHLQTLGLSPGPRFREILEVLLAHVLEHPETNTRAQLEALVRKGGFLLEASEPFDADHEGHE